jgi:hypothetical protein
VPSQLAQEFDALTNPETKRIDLEVPGLPMVSMSFYKSSERGNLFYVLLSGEVKEWFTSSIELGGRFLLARKTSGEKEWLDFTLPSGGQQGLSSGDKTYELIAVRPDWTDARALLGFYAVTDVEWQRFERALNGETSALLHKLLAALAIENRHFGYRVAREVPRFVDFAIEQTDGNDAAQRAALDVAVLAKILPKLHGSQAEVEQTLKRL